MILPPREPRSFLEALEPRIAPASFSYIDVDGDNVTITTSKGVDSDLQSAAHFVDVGVGQQLESLNLGSNPAFSGATVSIIAKRGSLEGDGLVNVGFIDGGSLDFGKITVDGDLGKILAGSGSTKTNAVATLDVFSLGAKGTSTGASDLASSLAGSVGEIDVASNIDTASIFFTTSGSKLGKLNVGGDIIGGSSTQQGGVFIDGTISSVSVGGSLIGGDGNESGRITAATLGSIIIKNSINGGAGNDSGTVDISMAGSSTSSFRVGQSITGGTGDDSGVIDHAGTIKTFTLGSLIGGDGDNAGQVVVNTITTLNHQQSISGKGGDNSGAYLIQTLGTASIGGDIFGGGGLESGGLSAALGIKQLTVKGSIYGAGANGSGFIETGDTAQIGTLTLKGNLFGSSGDDSGKVDVGFLSKASIFGSLFGASGDRSGMLELTQGFGSLTIGQSLVGGAGDYSGSIHLTDPSSLRADTLTIDGHLAGSSGVGSGSVLGTGQITGGKSIDIGGAIEGGQSADTGVVDLLGAYKTVSLGGLLHGGQGDNSGSVHFGSADKITLVGDLLGGLSSSNSGVIAVDGSVKTLALGGGILGGTNQSANPMTNSGAVLIGGNLGTVTVETSLIAGNENTATDLNLGAIRAGGTLTSLSVGGSMQGNADMPFMITAKGNPSATSKNLAIGSLSVDGDVISAEILAGYDITGTGINGDGGAMGGSAQIGTVTVKGDWNSASLVAGATTGSSLEWGTNTNALLAKPAAIVASIAKIVINGAIQGLPGQQSGFVAEQFTSFIAEGETLDVSTGPYPLQIGSLSTQTLVVVQA